MAEYWSSFIFASLWTETKSRSIKMLKRLWSISSHLDQTSLVNKGFVIICGIKNTLKIMIFVLVFFVFFFRALKRKPVICKSDGMIWVSHFSIVLS